MLFFFTVKYQKKSKTKRRKGQSDTSVLKSTNISKLAVCTVVSFFMFFDVPLSRLKKEYLLAYLLICMACLQSTSVRCTSCHRNTQIASS